MNARLIKETRDLLPIMLGTLVLIVVPYLIWHGNAEGFGYVALGLGCAVLAGNSFGNEFQFGTLPLLLSQPASRTVLWRDKMLILGAGIVTGLAVLLVCQCVYCPVTDHGAQLTMGLVVLCAFCGAPYFTLVYRQTIVGMACAAGVPIGLLGMYALATTWLGKDEPLAFVPAAILLTLYCAVTFWQGHARFKQLEVFDSAARELTLPASVEALLARPFARASSRPLGPFATLLRKEFRLQQVSFLLTGVFFLIAIVGFCVIPLYRPVGLGVLGGDFGLFMILLPLVAGATAVAEEKGWGVSEWHLTLPPSACQQWSAKMLATLPTSVVLGLLLPAALLLAGQPLLRGDGPGSTAPAVYGLGALVLAQLLLTSVAVYAGSFCKTTLRAILIAFAILIVSYGVFALAAVWVLSNGEGLLRGDSAIPVMCLGLLLLLGLTHGFAWSNFRRSGAPVRRVIIQILILAFAVGLGAMVTVAVSHPAHLSP